MGCDHNLAQHQIAASLDEGLAGGLAGLTLQFSPLQNYKLVEIASTGQVGIHCSQTMQRDRVKTNL